MSYLTTVMVPTTVLGPHILFYSLWGWGHLNNVQWPCDDLSPVHTGDKVEFNTVDFVESRLSPKPATNRQQSRLLPIRSTLLPACTGPKQHGRLCRLSTKSTVLNSTLSPVCTGLNMTGSDLVSEVTSVWTCVRDKNHTTWCCKSIDLPGPGIIACRLGC